MGGRFNLANFLTVLRLALTPLVIWAVLKGRHVEALALFLVAAVTDVLDGAAARRWGMSTKTGAYLDPVADKVLLSGIFLALAGAHTIPWWFVGLVLGRDVFILVGALVLMGLTGSRNFPPSVWGKVSTLFQIVTAVSWMTRNVAATAFVHAFSVASLWISAVLTLWSGLHYAWRGTRVAAAH